MALARGLGGFSNALRNLALQRDERAQREQALAREDARWNQQVDWRNADMERAAAGDQREDERFLLSLQTQGFVPGDPAMAQAPAVLRGQAPGLASGASGPSGLGMSAGGGGASSLLAPGSSVTAGQAPGMGMGAALRDSVIPRVQYGDQTFRYDPKADIGAVRAERQYERQRGDQMADAETAAEQQERLIRLRAALRPEAAPAEVNWQTVTTEDGTMIQVHPRTGETRPVSAPSGGPLRPRPPGNSAESPLDRAIAEAVSGSGGDQQSGGGLSGWLANTFGRGNASASEQEVLEQNGPANPQGALPAAGGTPVGSLAERMAELKADGVGFDEAQQILRREGLLP